MLRAHGARVAVYGNHGSSWGAAAACGAVRRTSLTPTVTSCVIWTTPQVATNKRYAGNKAWTVSEVAESVKADSGNIDILVGGGRLACGDAATACEGMLGA